MAKKRVRKQVSKKKTSKSAVARPVSQRRILVTPSKFRLVLKNLILFVILAVLSFVLYSVSTNQLYKDFFILLAWILGFIGVAFLISLLVLLFLKAIRK
jgi:ABC-type multidrug transport system permease subunit